MSEFTILILKYLNGCIILDDSTMAHKHYTISLFYETQVGINEHYGGVVELMGE